MMPKYRKLPVWKYALQEPYAYDTDIDGIEICGKCCDARPNNFVRFEDGTLTLSKGYSWDGASGPAIDTDTILRASLVHDGFYQLIREGALTTGSRKAADIIFRQICIEDGMVRIRAWWCYLAVRLFGQWAARVKSFRE